MNEKEKQAADVILTKLTTENADMFMMANAYRLLMEGVEHRVNAEKASQAMDHK